MSDILSDHSSAAADQRLGHSRFRLKPATTEFAQHDACNDADIHLDLSFNQITSMWSPLDETIRACQDAGLESVGLWRPSIIDFGEERAIEFIRQSGIKVSTLSFAGGFTGSHGMSWEEAVDDSIEAIRLASEIGCDTLVVSSGTRNQHTLRHARRVVVEGLNVILDMAAVSGVDLALAPMHRLFNESWTFINSLDDAMDIISAVDHPRMKLAFDLYHWWSTPDLLQRIPGLVPYMACVQLSDWRIPTRSDCDRVLPGEGVIPYESIFSQLVSSGYSGSVELQVWSSELWKQPLQDIVSSGARSLSGFSIDAISSPNRV